ncbi:hypothetical protein G5714_016415 [Onychostoma macrolepis]|uniref:MADF domain-containing protein n=1 Tax=Onychostoma macrolepis TaxID=369639 RepID=A0A7J6CCJ8_9TELE|nr:hypothetical protein G5714_016415 [Onychostoma macrolepis]
MEGKVNPTKVKRKWENLKQKFKNLKAPRTRVSTEGGEAAATSWKWYSLMDEALGQRPCISPSVIIDSAAQDMLVISPPNKEPSTSLQKRKKRDTELVAVFKSMQERDEARESMNMEREEKST